MTVKNWSITNDCCNCYNCESNRSCYWNHNPFTFKFYFCYPICAFLFVGLARSCVFLLTMQRYCLFAFKRPENMLKSIEIAVSLTSIKKNGLFWTSWCISGLRTKVHVNLSIWRWCNVNTYKRLNHVKMLQFHLSKCRKGENKTIYLQANNEDHILRMSNPWFTNPKLRRTCYETKKENAWSRRVRIG